MNDGALSQEEIDALLSGADDIGSMGDDMQDLSMPMENSRVQTGEMNLLSDVFNAAVQAMASMLTTMSGVNTAYSNIKASLKDPNIIRGELHGSMIQIKSDYSGSVSGENIFLIPAKDALKIAELFSNQPNMELNDYAMNILSEAFNSLNGTALNAISSKYSKQISFSAPTIDVFDDAAGIRFPGGSQAIDLSYNLNPENSSPISIHQVMSVPLGKSFIQIGKSGGRSGGGYVDDTSDYGGGGGRQKQRQPSNIQVRPVQFQNLEQEFAAQGSGNISLLLDIYMQLTVELGRTRMQIKEILGLGEGSIIELEKLAGEPVDLLVNGKLIAKGEVVVIDENFGVRVTEIVSPHERIDSFSS
jgi:flagellar motor switch protein FliN/FliY